MGVLYKQKARKMLQHPVMYQDYLTDAFVRLRSRLKSISGRIAREEAEDVLQDTFVRLWRRKYPLRSPREAEALLTRSVRNASLNERRKRRTESLPEEVPDERSGPQDREMAYAEMKRKIESELTDLQRYILEEKEYGGRSLEEIARELGMEAAAVRMQLSRARKTLRKTLSYDRED